MAGTRLLNFFIYFYWRFIITKILIIILILACSVSVFIHIQQDFQAWANQPIIYGPLDWKPKKLACERRARLINGYIQFVKDDRYCIVLKQPIQD